MPGRPVHGEIGEDFADAGAELEAVAGESGGDGDVSLAGQGIALSWSPSIDALLATGQLRRAHNFTARSTRGYFLARPQNAGPNPMVESFERWVLQEFGVS